MLELDLWFRLILLGAINIPLGNILFKALEQWLYTGTGILCSRVIMFVFPLSFPLSKMAPYGARMFYRLQNHSDMRTKNYERRWRQNDAAAPSHVMTQAVSMNVRIPAVKSDAAGMGVFKGGYTPLTLWYRCSSTEDASSPLKPMCRVYAFKVSRSPAALSSLLVSWALWSSTALSLHFLPLFLFTQKTAVKGIAPSGQFNCAFTRD